MARKKSHAAIGIERILRAVSVMHVPIDNQHTIEFIFISRHAGSDRDIVEEAKAHRSIRQRMMPGWPNQAQRGFSFSGHDAIDGVASRSGCEACNIERLRADDGIRVGHDRHHSRRCDAIRSMCPG